MPDNDQLSSEDLTALMKVRASLPTDDPRGPKIDAFIKSQLQNFVPDAAAQAHQQMTQSNLQPNFFGGNLPVTSSQQQKIDELQPAALQFASDVHKAALSTIGANVGAGAVEAGAAGLPFYLRALGSASGTGAGAAAGTLAGGGSPKEALEIAAATTGGTMLLSPVAKFIQDLAGKAKAGPLFQAVNEAAGQNHINTSGPLQVANEAKQLQNAGFTMPRVINRFLARMNSGEPMTFEEARRFEQAAGGRLAPGEAQNIRPQMYAKLSQFADAMRKSTMQAAGQSGQADTFSDALQMAHAGYQAQDKVEYIKELMLEMIKKAAIAGGAGAVGGGAAGYAYRAATKR